MAQLKYKNNVFNVSAGRTVLDTLLEQGHAIPNSCRAGACQSCVMQVTKGAVPEKSQKGLKDSHKAQGLFLACSCEPEEDIDIKLPDTEQLRVSATVSQINQLSHDVTELKVKTKEPFSYHAGQYVTLWRDNTLGRSYSLANLPEKNGAISFHIKLIANGQFSSWVHYDLQVGDTLFIQGPTGDCFYTPGNAAQNLLLVGTGTGLAPLYGIIHDALKQEHTGEIHLIHGALDPAGLYLTKELSELAKENSNINYHPCVLNSEVNMSSAIQQGDIINVVLQTVPKPKGWKIFLCGDEKQVKTLRKKIFLAGGNMNDIYADAFIQSATS